MLRDKFGEEDLARQGDKALSQRVSHGRSADYEHHRTQSKVDLPHEHKSQDWAKKVDYCPAENNYPEVGLSKTAVEH